MDKFLRFTVIFLGTYLLLSLFIHPQAPEDIQQKDDIEITLSESNPTIGNLVEVSLTNNTDNNISLGSGTPPEKLSLQKYKNGEWERLSIDSSFPENTELAPHTTQSFSYEEQNSEFFNTTGKYQVLVETGEKKFISDIEVEDAGLFKTIWRVFVWKPLYNILITLLHINAMNLGLAIIFLTLIVKFALFIPTKKGMESQRKMQNLQPELQKIKSRNAGNQQKIALESMEIWKKHNINPLGAMLPMLLQFPFLIALFYIIQEGLQAHQKFFLYPVEFLQNTDYSQIKTVFLGFMDLVKSPLDAGYEFLLLPILIAVVQYFAMKLSFARMKKQKEKNDKKNKNQPKPEGFMADFQAEFQKMNGVFLYLFPGMILIFSSTMPMGVGIYWLISTTFSIWQQYMVNKDIG